MKKIIVIAMLIAASFAAKSQDGNLESQSYFRFGYSLPSWKYFGYDDKSDWNDDVKRVGGLFEYGHIYMLNSIKLADGMRIGINVDFLSLEFQRFSQKSMDVSSNFVYVSSKIGPSFSYSPVNKLVFDTYFKFNPVWVAGNVQVNTVDDAVYLGFLGIKYSVGLNVRYSILMLGLEFNPGYAKFRYYDTDKKELTDMYIGNNNDNSDKTPVPGLNLTFGLSF